jgi:hypothetical protein
MQKKALPMNPLDADHVAHLEKDKAETLVRREKCMMQYVLPAELQHKYHSNPEMKSQSTARVVSKRCAKDCSTESPVHRAFFCV